MASSLAGAQSVPITGSGTRTLVDAVAGKRIKVYGYVVVATLAGTVRFEDTDGTDRSGTMSFSETGGAAPPSGTAPHFSTAAGQGLQVVTSAAVEGHLTYVVEP